MFYGLNRFIKNLLPKQLFYRALLIVAVPIITVLKATLKVFFDSLWIKTNKGMTRGLVAEIKTFKSLIALILIKKNLLMPFKNLNFNVKFVSFKILPKTKQ